MVADAELYYGNENTASGLQYPMAVASPQRFIDKGFLNDEDIYLKPFGWLELRIVNESKLYGTLSMNGISSVGFENRRFSGFDVDTIVVTQQYGNYDNEFPLFVYNADTNFRLRIDTFYTPKHDTTYYKIAF